MKAEGFTEVSWTFSGVNARLQPKPNPSSPAIRRVVGKWFTSRTFPPGGRFRNAFMARCPEVKPDLILAGDLGYGEGNRPIATFFMTWNA